MFTVTETAGVRLAKKLAGKRAGADIAMRFVRKPRGWKLRLDKPVGGDVLFAHDGRTVLVVDEQAAELLSERTLDTRDTPGGPKLCLR